MYVLTKTYFLKETNYFIPETHKVSTNLQNTANVTDPTKFQISEV